MAVGWHATVRDSYAIPWSMGPQDVSAYRKQGQGGALEPDIRSSIYAAVSRMLDAKSTWTDLSLSASDDTRKDQSLRWHILLVPSTAS